MIILYPSVCYPLPFAIPSFIFPFSVFGSGGWQMYVRLYKSNCNLGAKKTFLDAVAYPSLISSHPSPLPRILTNSHIMHVPHTCSIARVARFFLQIFFWLILFKKLENAQKHTCFLSILKEYLLQ